MTKKFVFDVSENDIVNVEENTVIKDTGVKTENVKETVMSTIKTSKTNNVRRFTKKTVFSLIAAAAAVAVLGTVSVGAAGGFNSTFGEYFAGQPAGGVFSGKDVSAESGKVNIDFKGIAGDDDQVVAVMTLKNKDGSPFVKTTDGTFFGQYNFAENGYQSDGTEYDVHIKKTLWDTVTNAAVMGSSSIEYSLRDDSTISAMVVCDNSGVYNAKSLKGQRLSISDSRIYAYTPVKTLYTAKDGIDNSSDILDELTEKYKDTLEDGQVIMYDSLTERNAVIVAEMTEIDLDLNVGVTLNYRSNTRTIDSANGKTYEIGGGEWTVQSLTARSFSLELSSRCFELNSNTADAMQITAEDMEDFDKIKERQNSFVPEKLTVTLKDGSEYTTTRDHLGYGGGWNGSENFGEINAIYAYTDKDGNAAALDPAEIVSVKYNGQELM